MNKTKTGKPKASKKTKALKKTPTRAVEVMVKFQPDEYGQPGEVRAADAAKTVFNVPKGSKIVGLCLAPRAGFSSGGQGVYVAIAVESEG